MKKIIYQLYPRLFGNQNANNVVFGSLKENGSGKFKDIRRKTLESIKHFGVTDIWLTGIIQHATTSEYALYGCPSSNPLIVKGRAGSPYAITNYYQVDPDLAVSVKERMNEFEDLVKRIHKQGMNVIIDFVANHVSRDYDNNSAANRENEHKHFLGTNEKVGKFFDRDNSYYYIQDQELTLPPEVYSLVSGYCEMIENYDEYPAKVTGDGCVTASPSFNSWYDTVKLNYGIDIRDNSKHFDPIPETWFCMRDILYYWLSKGVDGFRCDMAEMVPVEFWQWVINDIKSNHPYVFFIAEIYRKELYRDFLEIAKFDYLYDKIDMYDNLKSIIKGEKNVSCISDSWKQTDGFNDKMLRFIENHDEERVASSNFANDPIRGIPAFAVAAFMNKGPIMIYNGQELGERSEGISGYSGNDGKTTIFDYWGIDSMIRWNNNGYFDTKALTALEKNIRKKYKNIFDYISSEPIISEGMFYDLMWVNQHLIQENCYAFLRNIGQIFIVFIINFSSNRVENQVVITQHVRDFLGIADSEDIIMKFIIEPYSWVTKYYLAGVTQIEK